MKKILTLLASIGLVTITSASIVSCGTTSPHNGGGKDDGDKPTPAPDPNDPNDPNQGTKGNLVANKPSQTFEFTLKEKVQNNEEIKNQDKDFISETITNEFLKLNQKDWVCDKSTFTVSFTCDNYQNKIIITPQSKKIAVLCKFTKPTKDKYGTTTHWFNVNINLIS